MLKKLLSNHQSIKTVVSLIGGIIGAAVAVLISSVSDSQEGVNDGREEIQESD